MLPNFLRQWVVPSSEVQMLIRELNALHRREMEALQQKLDQKQLLCDMMLMRCTFMQEDPNLEEDEKDGHE